MCLVREPRRFRDNVRSTQVAGEYKVHIEFNGTFDGPAGPIRGSPFTFVAQEAYEYVQAHPKDFTYLEGKDPDQRALNEINSFDGPLLIADIVAKIKNIRDFAGKKKRGLAKLDPQNYEDMGPLIEVRSPRFEVLRCLHFTDTTRVHLTSMRVVSMMPRTGRERS